MTSAAAAAACARQLRAALESPYAVNDAILVAGAQFAQPHYLSRCAREVREFAREMLYARPYADVPACWRRVYEEAGCWVAVGELEAEMEREKEHGGDDGDGWVDRVVEALDLVLIMTGAEVRGVVVQRVFEPVEMFLETRRENAGCVESQMRSAKRRRLSSSASIPATESRFPKPELPLPNSFEEATSRPQPSLTHPLRRFENLSLAEFQTRLDADYAADPATGCRPFIVAGALQHWPAMKERPWNDPQYLLRRTLGGRRLVPIEVGRSYTADGWSQKIITFRQFLQEYILDAVHTTQQEPGYLAQHDLFAQIPALSRDIAVPDYCYSTPPPSHPDDDDDTSTEVLRNAWFGPAGTVSSLHTDPHHNVLAQPVGRKYVRLYAPGEGVRLYPRGVEDGVPMGNTSRVDLDEACGLLEDDEGDEKDGDGESRSERRRRFRDEFPDFEKAAYAEGVLEPGECLFVPRGWWHYVRSVSPSFSVSFWWD